MVIIYRPISFSKAGPFYFHNKIQFVPENTNLVRTTIYSNIPFVSPNLQQLLTQEKCNLKLFPKPLFSSFVVRLDKWIKL